ncbi:CPBP family glutamic-type intramembrane protease [Haliangium sp.]|uniref:CPBP family intramembrane glutamic endopeptidase n=1 Tax=Haliangium sp. TaxID=2663208 RepID=UPI003D0D7602
MASAERGVGVAAGPLFPAGAAVGVFAAAVAAMLVVGGALATTGVPALAMVLTVQLGCIGAVPVLAGWRRFGPAWPAALGLRRARPRALVGAVAVGLGFWYVNLALSAPLSRWLGSDAELEHLAELVSAAPMWLMLLALAAAPAVCEELLVRGVLTRALAPALGRVGAILAGAALFSLLHFSIARLVPTVLFGVVLGYAVLVTGSAVPGIFMHALNNAVALLLATGRLPVLDEAMRAHPIAWLAGALTACALGIALLPTGDKKSQ